MAGTLTRVEADGTSHELVFSASCGAAPLDGASIDLNAQRGKPSHTKQAKAIACSDVPTARAAVLTFELLGGGALR
ncbi:MAG TPA: hypothetical protein VKP30_14555 [Polyangiaceae bacterium]|nr:hypothetical protein [Polyangiaceae bacterium]